MPTDTDATEAPADTGATAALADADTTAALDEGGDSDNDDNAEGQKSATDAFNQCMIAAREAGRIIVPDLSIIGGILVLKGDGVCLEEDGGSR